MFEMTNFGVLHYFLGLEIKQREDGIFASQKNYVKNLLKRFNMKGCKMAAPPMNANKTQHLDDGIGNVDMKKFLSLVGSLIYLVRIRLDITFAVIVITRFMNNPSNHHYAAAKRILRYIVGTLDFGILYTYVSDVKLKCFTDGVCAGLIGDRRSMYGSVFILGSGALAWHS